MTSCGAWNLASMKVVQKISLRYIWKFFVSSNRKSSDLIALVSHYFATHSRRNGWSILSRSGILDSIWMEVHFVCYHQPSYHNSSISQTPLNLRPPGFCFRTGRLEIAVRHIRQSWILTFQCSMVTKCYDM